MKKCYKCNVNLNTNQSTCPLCHNNLKISKKDSSVFPTIPTIYKKHDLLFKLLSFLSLLAIVLCLFINFIITRHITWAWFVIAGITCFWITLTTAIKRRKYFIKMLFAELNLVIVSSLLWDYFTGFYRWSINYVLPITCVSYTVVIFVMRIFFKYYIKDHVFYMTFNCFIGLVPVGLLFFEIVSVTWPSFVSVIVSICVISMILIFNKKSLTKELQRRLHF